MKDPIVERWLTTEFSNKSTQTVYRSALRLYQERMLKRKSMSMAISRYKGYPDELLTDLKRFMNSWRKPLVTRKTYANAVRLFFAEHGIPISDVEWKKAKRRLARGQAETADRAPTKAELRQIVNLLDTKGRSLILFLSSTGARIGETLQLKANELNLQADPPRATIRNEYTKFGKSGRVVFMSYEARDALRAWLNARSQMKKRAIKNCRFNPELAWDISRSTVTQSFNRAVRKARLEKRDPVTKRRTLHIHSLRKFFRSNISLDFDIVQALMGHRAYLDRAYLRIGEAKLSGMYLEKMGNVSIFQVPQSRREQIKRMLIMSGATPNEFADTVRELIAEQRAGSSLGGGRAFRDEWEPDLNQTDKEFVFSLTDEQLTEGFRRLRDRNRLQPRTATNGGSPLQKVIGESETESHLARGWRYVGSLNGDRIIVERT